MIASKLIDWYMVLADGRELCFYDGDADDLSNPLEDEVFLSSPVGYYSVDLYEHENQPEIIVGFDRNPECEHQFLIPRSLVERVYYHEAKY